MVIKSSASRKLAIGLAAWLLSMGAAHAELLKETGLGNGMWSGGLQLPVMASSANYWSGFQTIDVNDGSSVTSFLAFCVDPYQWSSGSYSTYTGTDFNTFFGSRAADVSALYNQAFAGALSGNLDAAAMQLALWEVANDDQNLTAGGVRTVSGTNSALKSAAQGLLSNLGAYSGPSQYTFTVYTSGSNQDFLVAAPIPEPGTYAMMLAGIGLMGLVAHRGKHRMPG